MINVDEIDEWADKTFHQYACHTNNGNVLTYDISMTGWHRVELNGESIHNSDYPDQAADAFNMQVELL